MTMGRLGDVVVALVVGLCVAVAVLVVLLAWSVLVMGCAPSPSCDVGADEARCGDSPGVSIEHADDGTEFAVVPYCGSVVATCTPAVAGTLALEVDGEAPYCAARIGGARVSYQSPQCVDARASPGCLVVPCDGVTRRSP